MLEKLTLYLVAAAGPLALWALFALFRWRYMRLVRRTISTAPTTATDIGASSGRQIGTEVRLNWIDAASVARIGEPEALHAALSETRRTRRLFAAAGGLYILCAALIVWYGRRLPGNPIAVAVSFAYYSTLPGVFIVLAFSGRTLASWVLAAVAWLAAAVALLGGLGIPWPAMPGLILDGVEMGAMSLPCIALLVPRTIRPLIVAFVPLVAVLAVLTVGFLLVLNVNVDEIPNARPVAWVGGLVATVLGVGFTVWRIRKGFRLWDVGVLVGLICVWLASVEIAPSLALTLIGGIGTNGLFTLFVWGVFSGVLRLKAGGFLPDEMLHFAFCWLVLTGFLPLMAGPTWDVAVWAVTVFSVFFLVLIAATASHRRLGPAAAPPRMLLLRVFGHEPLRNRLIDLLDDSWRRLGRVDLVVGVDLAVRTVSARSLEGFLLGRVDRQFLDSVSEADKRIGELPERRALDGRYPLNELHCSADVWQHVVTALALDAHVVLMDLRGFQAANAGAMFELSLVIERVRLGRIVLLTNKNTDEATLIETVQRTWHRLPDSSANARLIDPKLDVLRCIGPRSIVEKAIANCVFRAAEWVVTPNVLPAHAG